MRTLARTLTVAALATTLLAPPALATEATPPPAAPQPAAKEFRNTCDPAKAVLPGVVEGDPALQPGVSTQPLDGTRTGLYVWHDTKGWRVRFTHNKELADGKAQRVEVRGFVTSSRPISKVRLVKLEQTQRGEWVSVKRPGRKVLDFRFVNYGGIDGVNFTAGCAGRLTFTAWTVTRMPDGTLEKVDGKVKRTPVSVFVGKPLAPGGLPTQVTAQTDNPRLISPPTDATKVRILRTPVPAAT